MATCRQVLYCFIYIKEVSAHDMGCKSWHVWIFIIWVHSRPLIPLGVCYITPHITSHSHSELCVETLIVRCRSYYSTCITGFDEKIHTSVADGSEWTDCQPPRSLSLITLLRKQLTLYIKAAYWVSLKKLHTSESDGGLRTTCSICNLICGRRNWKWEDRKDGRWWWWWGGGCACWRTDDLQLAIKPGHSKAFTTRSI